VFLRSAAKPFIAAAVVRSGAAERFRFDRREIALIAASHSGEPLHLETARSILAKIGASERDLACGVPAPGASQLQNNCSGKHAGILALARMLDAPLAGYLDAEHPAQRAILAFCERVFEDRFGEDRLGIDGCGIPNFAVSLATAARTFARFATLDRFDEPDRAALAQVRAAMLGRPWFVGGTGRFDTDLMEAVPGALVAKSGAEGVHATALLGPGLGLVLKVVDGSRRAVAPATLALLRQLGVGDGIDSLRAHERRPVRNVAGRIVGEISARHL
jgi:L-asparaginase II